MRKSLKNKTVLITGGSKGIGYSIAKALLREGVNVAITSRTLEAAEQAANTLNENVEGKILPIQADVRSYVDQENMVSRVINEFGCIDIVIANAGVGHFASVDEISLEEWNEVIDVNLTGVFYTVKSTVAELEKTKGYLITIASLAGTNFFANGAAYNASKYGLVGITQAVMLDLRHKGIKVTTIMPGSVATEFSNRKMTDKDAWKIQPEDIGQIVIDLLKMPARTLPSKIEVRPSVPPLKK